jgi:hypothetical protein
MKRSLEEVKARCKIVLNDEVIINLVEKSSSPTAAYEMIMAEIGNQAKAKAGRWLAILRRDFYEDYQSINSNQVTLQQHDKEEESKNEGNVHQRSQRIRRWIKCCIAWMGKSKEKAW